MMKMHHNVFTNKLSLFTLNSQFNMKNKFTHKKLARWERNGFALISTLMIMMLLMLVALAMLSLSNTSVRSATLGKGASEAKANARMALMLAIGELQMHTGSDTRITAPAEILESGAPPLTGVWRSWEGTNHDSSGRPIKPDYTVKTKSESTSGRFLTWLVSGAQPGQEPLFPAPTALVSTVATADTIPLLSSGTLGSKPGQVHVTPQLVNEESGAIGWWVSPENQKARLMHPHSPRTNDALGWADAARTHTVPDPTGFGLEATLSDFESYTPDPNNAKTTRRAISLDTTEFLAAANPENPQQSFHDLSISAIGLLTNSATGGWRKDLSILSERWDNIYSNYPGAPNAQLPLFRFTPDAGATATSQVPKPTTTSYAPPQSNLYPWSEYFQIGHRKYPMTYSAASASWQSLINFVNSYKTIDIDSSSLTLPTAEIEWQNQINRTGNNDYYRYYHGTSTLSNLQPVVARYQMIVQVNAEPDPRYGPSGNHTNYAKFDEEKYYRVNFRLVPYITLWNPYNIELTRDNVRDIGFGTHRSLPCAISFINGTAPPAGGHNFRLINSGNSQGVDRLLERPDGRMHYYDYQIPENITKGYTPSYISAGIRSIYSWLPRDFSLKPGEVKIFAPGFDMQSQANTRGIRLKKGLEVGDDWGMPLVKKADVAASQGKLIEVASSRPKEPGYPVVKNSLLTTDILRIAVKSDRHTKNYSNDYSNETGAGIFYSLGTSSWGLQPDGQNNQNGVYEDGNVSKGVQNQRAVMGTSVVEEWAQKYWPSSALEEIQIPVSEIVPTSIDPNNPEWTNILSLSFGPRLTFGAGSSDPEGRPTKGMLQTNPFALNTFSIPEKQASFHPANGAYDLSYHSMTFNSELSPEVGEAGYIVTGFQSGEGLSRLITSEIPLAPMASLAELQGWNLRGGNPLPPHQFNLIGNSDATPMMPQDGVVIANPALMKGVDSAGLTQLIIVPTASQILQHDDAYCANHVLFDDWFFSTVMPQPSNFGNTITKNISTVFRDFLEGTDMLTNRAYRTVSEDTKLSSTKVTELVDEMINGSDGWLKIASRFEVDGMFNVNSTSVKAWRAILGHARKQQVAYYSATGIDIDSTERDHVVSRTTVASDVAAGSAFGVGAQFPNGSEYAGFRTLTSDQLDELAEKIVEQVKERGPFLSLSEFVNRQLSLEVGADGKELALAGALQAALDSLSQTPDPDDPLKTLDPNAALKDPAKQLSSVVMDPADDVLDGVGYDFIKASEGYSTHGFPGWIRQADILRPIAPVLSARDDTFTIRAYGDYRDENGVVIASAWCEATVQRRRYFVDPADDADSIDPPLETQNIKFGRRYDILKFRWLAEDEV
jgi:hypothetical protein